MLYAYTFSIKNRSQRGSLHADMFIFAAEGTMSGMIVLSKQTAQLSSDLIRLECERDCSISNVSSFHNSFILCTIATDSCRAPFADVHATLCAHWAAGGAVNTGVAGRNITGGVQTVVWQRLPRSGGSRMTTSLFFRLERRVTLRQQERQDR